MINTLSLTDETFTNSQKNYHTKPVIQLENISTIIFAHLLVGIIS